MKYDLGYGKLGNGVTVYNRAEEEGGDYKTVAHIASDGKITYRDKKMPASVKAKIEKAVSKMDTKTQRGSSQMESKLTERAEKMLSDREQEIVRKALEKATGVDVESEVGDVRYHAGNSDFAFEGGVDLMMYVGYYEGDPKPYTVSIEDMNGQQITMQDAKDFKSIVKLATNMAKKYKKRLTTESKLNERSRVEKMLSDKEQEIVRKSLEKATGVDVESEVSGVRYNAGNSDFAFDGGGDTMLYVGYYEDDPKPYTVSIENMSGQQIAMEDAKDFKSAVKLAMKMAKKYKKRLTTESKLDEAVTPKQQTPEQIKAIVDKLKTNQKIQLWYDSPIKKGENWVPVVVGRRSFSKKYNVGKITLRYADAPRASKLFFYDQDGKISLALGNLAARLVAIKTSVNEGKMPNKYIGNDEIVYLKTKEDNKGANYNLYYKGYDIEAGGIRVGSEKELKNFAKDYILSNQMYNKLKYEKPKALPESVNEESYKVAGKQLKESTKAYEKALQKMARDNKLKMLSKSDKEKLIKIAQMLKKANESVNEESYKVAGKRVTLVKGKKSDGTDWKVKFENGKEVPLSDVLSLIKPFPKGIKEIKFSKAQLNRLGKEYEKIKGDKLPLGASKKLKVFLSMLDKEALEQMRDAKIKFISDEAGKILKKATNESSLNEAKKYKKGDELKIKLKNGKEFDLKFDSYSRQKGVAFGKFKDEDGEYTTKPFALDTIVESLNEADYKVYHKSFTASADEARKFAEKRGFEIDEDDWQSQIGLGGRNIKSRPSVGKTHNFTVGLLKDGKPQRKALQISVYGMKNGYELNAYIN